MASYEDYLRFISNINSQPSPAQTEQQKLSLPENEATEVFIYILFDSCPSL
jgi:hypothetical protein